MIFRAMFCAALLSACGGVVATSPSSPLSVSTHEVVAMVNNIPADATVWEHLSWSAYYGSLLAATTDQEFSIGGHALSGALSALRANEPKFMDLDGAYASVSAGWQDAGVDPRKV